MTTITQAEAAYKQVLVEHAERLGRSSGYSRRRSKLMGPQLAQILVAAYQLHSQPSVGDLAQVAGSLGVTVTPQGIDARFNERTAAFLQQLLEVAMAQVVNPGQDPALAGLCGRFNGIYLQDSTTLPLPAELAARWPGFGTNQQTPTAGLKVQVQLEWTQGQVQGLHLQPARSQDRQARQVQAPLPPGSVWVADLGYFSLPALDQAAAAGGYFVTRIRAGTRVWVEAEEWGLEEVVAQAGAGTQLDLPIRLGQRAQVPARLVGWRVPQAVADQRRRRLREGARTQQRAVNATSLRLAEWTLIVTNLPPHLASPQEVGLLLRLRWQVELLFKRWKSLGKLTTCPSRNPWRILCEVYARLLALLCQHWLLILGGWTHGQHSLWRLTKQAATYALSLMQTVTKPRALTALLRTIQDQLRHGVLLDKRRERPNVFQCLAQFTDIHA